MSPQQLLGQLWGDGIRIGLSLDGKSLTAPVGKLTDADRALILANKQSLLRFLAEVQATTVELLKAAMLVCDHHGDGDADREQMRLECLDTPPHLRADLLECFRGTYSGAGAGGWK